MILDMVLFIIGGLLILYYMVSTLALGPVSFSAVLLALGILLTVLGLLDRKFGHLSKIIKLKKMLIPVAIAALICFVTVSYTHLDVYKRQDHYRRYG